jgi:transcription antitermination factor NusG
MMAEMLVDRPENISRPLWFAVGVKPRHEKAVGDRMSAHGLESFVPVFRERRVWSDRMKLVDMPLFAGYAFCRFQYADRLTVRNIQGVTAILGGGRIFSPIDDDQIAALKTLSNSGAARPCAYLLPGQTVQVERGPFAGIRGLVLRSKGVTSLVVSLEILQRSVAVEVDADSVAPVRPLLTMSAGAAGSRQVYP